MSRMNDRRAVLPTVQAMWYVPQGLNIWEQIICEFPGHYARDAEKCNTKFPGPDADVNRFGYQNIGHKALRARALIDIADYFGWDNAREVIYTVVPDLGCSPRLYGLWTEISNLVAIELPNAARIAKRTDTPMTEPDLDQLT